MTSVRSAPAPAPAPSPHVARKRARRRAEIVRAALAAFRDKGYHRTRLDDIARRVGIRSTALYHYFPDKETLLYHCHRESLAQLERLLAEVEAGPGDPGPQLTRLVREHVRVMIDTLAGSPLAFEVTALSPAHQRDVIARRDRFERALRGVIERGQAAGVFRPIDAKLATFAMLGAINWIARWYRPDGAADADRVGAEFADYLVGGLSCR